MKKNKSPEFPYQMEIKIWGDRYTNCLCKGSLEDAQQIANELCKLDTAWKKVLIHEANDKNTILLSKNR